MTQLYSRFPEIEPFAVHQLRVSALHSLYVEEIGNPRGIPVLFLHGGPGIGALPVYRRLFDPQLFHTVLFSQRGAPPSTPVGEVGENDTWQLVEDIEAVRALLGMEHFILFGGSWGSTLALAYALRHPQPVAALVLRGIFLGRQRELDWLYRDGASRIFPEAWQEFLTYIPEAERGDLVAAYYRRLMDADPRVHQPAAWRWAIWEDHLGTLLPGEPTPFTDAGALAIARIECHYMAHHLFLETDDYLLREAHRLQDIPCHIVQGRYDMICPVESALALAQQLPQAQLHLVADAGHSSSEPGITSELIAALLSLSGQLKF